MRFYILLLYLLITIHGVCQEQHGIIKTIGRPGRPGRPLADVAVRVQGLTNSVLTSADGTFIVMLREKRDGDSLIFRSISKSGYELLDKTLIGRPYVFSSQVPIEILMVDLKQLEADKRRIEERAYQKAEETYRDKLSYLERQKDKSQLSLKQYQKALLSLQANYERYTALISNMADRYARTDYDRLDSLDRRINLYIENGDLDKADSLIHAVFEPTTVLERNRAAKDEIRQRMIIARQIINKATADKDAILQDLKYGEGLVAMSINLSDEYIAQGQLKDAVDCLEKALHVMIIIYGNDDIRVLKMRERIEALMSETKKII